MKHTMKWFAAAGLITVLAGCGAAHHGPHWSYEGETGPKHWGELAKEYRLCESGVEQSPIDLKVTQEKSSTKLEFSYQPTDIDVVNNGHTVKFNYKPGSFLSVDGKKYELKQFHYHVPSEHTVNGGHFPIEIHLVHQDEEGHLAVVGMMIKEGTTNQKMEPVIKYLPYENGEKIIEKQATIDMSVMLPKHTERFFHYRGSLTTPPCSESVEWFVLTDPIRMSDEQITEFSRIYQDNNRPVNPLGSRTLYLD